MRLHCATFVLCFHLFCLPYLKTFGWPPCQLHICLHEPSAISKHTNCIRHNQFCMEDGKERVLGMVHSLGFLPSVGCHSKFTLLDRTSIHVSTSWNCLPRIVIRHTSHNAFTCSACPDAHQIKHMTWGHAISDVNLSSVYLYGANLWSLLEEIRLY